jgi:uncharacterized protein YwgA
MDNEKDPFLLLSSVWKKLGSPNMEKFGGRLLLQKKIYLLQELGLNLGYGFNFYIHGPYSSQLASDGFKVQLNEEMVDNNSLSESEAFRKLESIEKGHEGEESWFELLGAIVYLNKERSLNKEEIEAFVKDKKSYLYKKTLFDEAYNKLIKEGIIS